MVLPAYVGVIYFGTGIYPAWVCFTVYVCLKGLVFRWRYGQEKWKEMRVIERTNKIKVSGIRFTGGTYT